MIVNGTNVCGPQPVTPADPPPSTECIVSTTSGARALFESRLNTSSDTPASSTSTLFTSKLLLRARRNVLFPIIGTTELSVEQLVNMIYGSTITIYMSMGSVNISLSFCNDIENTVLAGSASVQQSFSKFFTANDLQNISNRTCTITGLQALNESHRILYIYLQGNGTSLNNGTIDIADGDQLPKTSTESAITTPVGKETVLSGGFSAGAIAGIVGGSILLAILIIIVITIFVKVVNRSRQYQKYTAKSKRRRSIVR